MRPSFRAVQEEARKRRQTFKDTRLLESISAWQPAALLQEPLNEEGFEEVLAEQNIPRPYSHGWMPGPLLRRACGRRRNIGFPPILYYNVTAEKRE